MSAAPPGKLPFERTYWVEAGRLMAGPYPGEYDAHATARNARALLECGIRSVISLMEGREEGRDPEAHSAYVSDVEAAARRLGVNVEYQRFAIHDMSVPVPGHMDAIQAAIEDAVARDLPVYTHCWAGRGRTGTVVGAYLIRRGLATPEDFVEVIGDLRRFDAGSSPETAEQIELVREWARRAKG